MWKIAGISLAAHLVLLVAFGSWVVIRSLREEKVVFVAPAPLKDPRLVTDHHHVGHQPVIREDPSDVSGDIVAGWRAAVLYVDKERDVHGGFLTARPPALKPIECVLDGAPGLLPREDTAQAFALADKR